MSDLSHNDQPISNPSEDRFGVDPFAAALAKSILKIKSPAGSVIALNGPWGSGKSSALNLIRHHLKDAVKKEDIAIIDFTCWWFRGEEALALAFFRELYAGLAPTLGDRLNKSLPKLGARLLKAGAVLGSAADLAGAGGAGEVAGRAMEWLGGLIQQEEGVEKLHADLSKALKEQPRRFLVVIDDIDRLSPDEALLIFRLVKSVGRLPNVMYLLVYDRKLAERIVSERFPSEGPHYLEKIVQAAFELPEPMATDMQQLLRDRIMAICGDPPEEHIDRFDDIFYQGVAPEMRTPRDIARFANALDVTWPAVAGDVDVSDFIALETIRLLHPELYRAIRQNKDALIRVAWDGNITRKELEKKYDDLILCSVTEARKERIRSTLAMLFQALQTVWGSPGSGKASANQLASWRRVCSERHFDAYFRLATDANVLSAKELDALIAKAHSANLTAAEMREATTVRRPSGGTKAAVILDELTWHAMKVSEKDVQPLLSGLFEVADDINVDANRADTTGSNHNYRRLHFLARTLTGGRFTLEQRSRIYVAACQTASLGWLARFAHSAWRDYHPEDGGQRAQEENCLTTSEDAVALRQLVTDRIVKASEDGSLLSNPDLANLLVLWRVLVKGGDVMVKQWITVHLASEWGVRRLAAAFASIEDQGISKYLSPLTDVAAFRRRVEEVAAGGEHPEVAVFLDAWRRQEQGAED